MKPDYTYVLVQETSENGHAVGVMFSNKHDDKRPRAEQPNTHWHSFTKEETELLITGLQKALELHQHGHTWFVAGESPLELVTRT